MKRSTQVVGVVGLIAALAACGDDGGGGGSGKAPLTKLGSVGEISLISVAFSGEGRPNFSFRYEHTQKWAWFGIDQQGSYVVDLDSGEILRDCDDDDLALGSITYGRTGLTELLQFADAAQGTLPFRVVEGVLEAIHEGGIARCQLSSDLTTPGTRLGSVYYDFGSSPEPRPITSSLITAEGIWTSPERLLSFDGTATSIDWPGGYINNATPLASGEGFMVASTDEVTSEIVGYTTDTAGIRTEVGRVAAGDLRLVTSQAVHVATSGGCNLIMADGSGVKTVAGPCSGTVTEDGLGYVIEEGWYPLDGGAGVVHDTLSDITSLPTPFGVAVHITRNREADFSLGKDFTIWTGPNDVPLTSTTPGEGLVVRTQCNSDGCFSGAPSCAWYASGICTCAVEGSTSGTQAVFHCTTPGSGVTLEPYGRAEDFTEPYTAVARPLPAANAVDVIMTPSVPIFSRSFDTPVVGVPMNVTGGRSHQAFYSVQPDLSLYQLTDNRIWSHGWRDEISYDHTIAVAGDGSVYLIDIP